MRNSDQKTDPIVKWLIWLSGAVSGMILGAIIALLSCHPSPDDLCETDCHARGFHEGVWSFSHERCSCFNTEFEVQG